MHQIYIFIYSLSAFSSLTLTRESCPHGGWRCQGDIRQQCAHSQWYSFPCPHGYTCVRTYDCELKVNNEVSSEGGSKGGEAEESGKEEGLRRTEAVTRPTTKKTEEQQKGKGKQNRFLVSEREFSNAVQACDYPRPTKGHYINSVGQAGSSGGIVTRRELAMFLAQILWESGGLKYKEEIACKETKCPGSYRLGIEEPDKYYYGRGYIQLTWLYNYKACSQALFGNESILVRKPELVSKIDSIAWGCAFWFWKENVHNAPGVQDGQFGATTLRINGFHECNGGAYQFKAKKRFTCYSKVLKAFHIDEKPKEEGCYEMEKPLPEVEEKKEDDYDQSYQTEKA